MSTINPKTLGWNFTLLILLLVALLAPCTQTRAGEKGKGLFSGKSSPKGKGIPWTIMCLEYPGLQHHAQMQQIADALKNTKGIKAAEVRLETESDGYIRLYYGTYFRKTDPKNGKRDIPKKLREDLDLIRELGVGPGQNVFIRARMVPMPIPDVGNPEWALTTAKGIYTLQIASFEPTDDFWDYKAAAAEFCEYLRGKGYEAYYHHAAGGSVVTVGAFGSDAIIEQTMGPPRYSQEIVALQEDELLKHNLLNGGIVKTKKAAATFVTDVSSTGSSSNSRTPGSPNVVMKGAAVDLMPDANSEGVPVLSRLVFIPGREPQQP